MTSFDLFVLLLTLTNISTLAFQGFSFHRTSSAFLPHQNQQNQLSAIGTGHASFTPSSFSPPVNYTFTEDSTTVTLLLPSLPSEVNSKSIRFKCNSTYFDLGVDVSGMTDFITICGTMKGSADEYGSFWNLEDDNNPSETKSLSILLAKEPLKIGKSMLGDDDWYGVLHNETTISMSYRSLDGSDDEDLDVDEYVESMVSDVRGGFDMSKVDKSVYDSIKDSAGMGDNAIGNIVESLKSRVVGDDVKVEEVKDEDEDEDEPESTTDPAEMELKLADFVDDEDGVRLEEGTVDLRTVAVDTVGDYKL